VDSQGEKTSGAIAVKQVDLSSSQVQEIAKEERETVRGPPLLQFILLSTSQFVVCLFDFLNGFNLYYYYYYFI
jgi:hypothetical protein